MTGAQDHFQQLSKINRLCLIELTLQYEVF